MSGGIDQGTLATAASIWKRQRHGFEAPFLGTSMLPTVRSGELLRVRCTDHIEPGDVIVYLDGSGGVVVHRLIRISHSRLITRGDGTAVPDAPVDASTVVGRVESVHRDGSWIRIDSLPPPRRADLPARIVANSLWVGDGIARAIVRLMWLARRLLIMIDGGARSQNNPGNAPPE